MPLPIPSPGPAAPGRRSAAVPFAVLAVLLALLLPAAASAAPVTVMPLGDSITHGENVPGGYRMALEDALVADGVEFDFVGTSANGPAELADPQHEGHPGWRIDQIAAGLDAWLARHRPEVVLLLIGTNDVLQNRVDLPTSPDRLDGLIDQIAAGVPAAEIVVSTLPPLTSPGREERARAFNARVPGIVAAQAERGRAVTLVDMHSALTAPDDLADGIHPTRAGYDKMAAVWHAGLQRTRLARPASVPPTDPVPSEPPHADPAPAGPSPVVEPAPTGDAAPVPVAPVTPAPTVIVPIEHGPAIPARPATSASAQAPVRVMSRRLRADRRGRVAVRLSCRTARRCAGTLRLRVASGSRAGEGLASSDFRIRGRRAGTVRLQLDERGLRRLRSELPVSVEAVVGAGDARRVNRTPALVTRS